MANPNPAPVANFPNADLRPDGAMRFYGTPNPYIGLQIDVMNVGTTPASGRAGRVSIGGSMFNVALYQYYGGTATTENTVMPNERGYLRVDVPPTLLTACTSYSVQIDIDHTMQDGGGAYPVFDNDTRNVLAYQTGTVCRLTWTSPINGATLGQDPDAHAAGKSLQDIVSSIERGRVDNLLCSNCHSAGLPNTHYLEEQYQPNVTAGVASAPIDPFVNIGGNRSWGLGSNPWARQFIGVPDGAYYSKPAYLKNAFQKWLADGAVR